MSRIKKIRDDLNLYWAVGSKLKKLFRKEKTIATFYLRNLQKPRNLAFDIGANQGEYSKILATLYKKVISFEPQSEMLKKLLVQKHSFPNIEIVPKAISDKDGKAKIFISKQNEMSSLERDWINSMQQTKRFGLNEWKEERDIDTTTLERVINQFGVPDFIKVDVEGHELKVFKTLNQPLRNIAFECTPEARHIGLAVINKIISFGNYSFFLVKNSEMLGTKESEIKMQADQIINIISSKKFSTPDFFDIYATLDE